MKSIQMVDLHSQYLKIKQEIDNGIFSVIETSSFVKGGKVVDFQRNLEKYLDVKHVIPVANGTDALQIALMSLGLKAGDEVITPTFTFIATAEVVALLGLTPVVVDVDFDTFCIDTQEVEKAITPKTKAIVPVHLFGQNANMEEILKIARKHNLFVVEDACQSMGSHYIFENGEAKHSGTIGDIGCTSFFPSKNLGCYGDGGAIFTNNDVLAEKITMIANHGMKIRYYHDIIGVNSRLDSIQAAVLEAKLPHLDNYVKSRQNAAHFYNEKFKDCKKVITPVTSSFSTHSFHQYTLKLVDVNREKLIENLKERGIPAMIYYPIPLHLQKAYQDARYKAGDFPVSEHLSQCVASLPMHTELDNEQLNHISENFLKIIADC
ncbi:MAG: DegT/DnrJ/EryC1/StrS family aminotransferase [Prevotellaceae bacterium]|jgi:dTDP-4-amino-4,6-dideoxygalactose transaminase|nr:DegT/DnrJ/EryC1/StrS family aminotransferase [Prevotellaceae bacterium]